MFLSEADQERWAKTKGKTDHEVASWRGALAAAAPYLEKAQPGHGDALLNAATTTRQLGFAAQLLGTASEKHPLKSSAFEAFIAQVDESQYTLASWLVALDVFAAWLDDQGRPVEVPKMLGYIECCAKATEGKCYPGDLKDITQEMLGNFGYNG